MALLFLRMVLFVVAATLVVATVAGVIHVGRGMLDLQDTALSILSVLAGLIVIIAIDAALLALGGRMLRRFDVARDRA